MTTYNYPKKYRVVVHANGRFYSSRHAKQMSVSSHLTSYSGSEPTALRTIMETIVYYNGEQIAFSHGVCWMTGRKYPNDIHLFILD